MKLIYLPLPATFVAPSWPLPEAEKTAQPSTFATAGDRDGSNSEVFSGTLWPVKMRVDCIILDEHRNQSRKPCVDLILFTEPCFMVERMKKRSPNLPSVI